jgi:hypothetical protein
MAMIGDLAFLFDWQMYPTIPYNAGSIYEMHKMEWNKIK